MVAAADPMDYPASANQRRMYILNRLSPDGIEYNVPIALKLEGPLEVARLRGALAALVSRHPSLRTSFRMIGEQIVQRIRPSAGTRLPTRRALTETELAELAKRFVRPFDLRQAPLMRACLARTGRSSWMLLLDLHHIICDGVSVEILLRELGQLYDGQALPQLDTDYKDFSLWQSRLAETPEIKRQEQFWLELVGTDRPELSLQTDHPRHRALGYAGDRVLRRPDEQLTTALRELAATHRASTYMVLLAAYYVLLSRYTGQEDLLVGTLVSGRQGERFRDVVGLFVNTLLLRGRPAGTISFSELVDQVRDQCLNAYENQDYQFEDLVDLIDPPRELGRNPIFDTMFASISYNEEAVAYRGVSFIRGQLDLDISKLDLSLTAIEHADQSLELELEYRSELFRRETIEQMSNHYMNVLRKVIRRPHDKLAQLEILTSLEQRRARPRQRLAAPAASRQETVVELFQAQAQSRPNATALIDGLESLSYGALDRRSNELAARLAADGAGRGALVGVSASPGFEMVVAVLAVLKAGAAYLPLDRTTPRERFLGIVADSGMKVLLIDDEQPRLECPDIVTLRLGTAPGPAAPELHAPWPEPTDLAYVIYTSGSTGRPKGVMITHGSLSSYLGWAVKTYVRDERVCFALHSPLSVDLTVTSLFTPLVTGNQISIFREPDGVELMRRALLDNQIDLIKLTPTHLGLLNEARDQLEHGGRHLRRIIVGGEELRTDLARSLHSRLGGHVEILNEYGPTEATVGCMIHRFDPEQDQGRSVPIGQATENAAVVLLDRHGCLVPDGAVGELYIAGECLAAGYLNNEPLTRERFVAQRLGPAKVRLYRSGDLARRLPNGQLVFVGRNDEQVKVRGYRVEPGEIEAALTNHPGITKAAVVARADATGERYLCAYLVAKSQLADPELRSWLARSLPEHLIPSWFVRLDHLPLGRGGKLDRLALPDPREVQAAARPYQAPRTEIEARLAAIWERVLDIDRVGIDDSFFELGGQSLKATVMSSRVNRELGAGISLKDVFAFPVVRDLAALIERTGQSGSPAIEPAVERAYYPVSSSQKRLFILQQLAPDEVQYNAPLALEITGPFDAERWRASLAAAGERHESLRTSFEVVGDEIVQVVHPRLELCIETPDHQAGTAVGEILERFVRPFALDQAPLLRVMIIEQEESRRTLLIDMHHIIADGISVDILLSELCATYRGQRPEPLTIQYKDYATWQHAHSQTEEVQAQGAYWRRLYQDQVPILELPTDLPRGAVQSFEGGVVSFDVNEQTASSLRDLNKKHGTTMHMVLLAVYTVLLSKYSGQDDIVVGTPVSGRHHASVQEVVGMFVNTLAMRNQPRAELGFSEYLAKVRENALDAYSNQEYQFEELVETLEIERDLSRSPLFDTMLAFQDSERRHLDLGDARLEVLDIEWRVSKFDLTLLATEHERGLRLELEYCSRLFHRSTVERLARHYRHLLEQIAARPDLRISELELATEAERRLIIDGLDQAEQSYPSEQSIHAIFEQQVAAGPQRLAVVSENGSLTYEQLSSRANQLARSLIASHASANEIIAIIATAGTDMLVAILGVLKAGCAYLPIDPECPEQRALAMLDESQTRIVLHTGEPGWRDQARLMVDLGDPRLYQGDASNLGSSVSGRDPAYVIFTSGTTGTPKGVLVEHHSVNNLCRWHIDAFEITDADRATKYARFEFDASVWEIFPYLQAGASIYTIKPELRLDVLGLNHFFEEHGITISFLPTPVCEQLNALDNSSLRVLLTGGDRLRRFRPRSYRLINNYGPTEYTVVTSSGEVHRELPRIPIGKPLPNTRVYILGPAGELLPVGVPGELCISGAGLARGYLNDAGRTAERFVPSPFETGARMYRSGDIARWLPDGCLEFIGRKDDQVKIRGCRTEPREVEATILAHEAVRDAAVVVRADENDEPCLYAYVVWHEAAEPEELRRHLDLCLPDYMAPQHLITIERVPLTDRGKVDLGALPSPAADATGRGRLEAPRTPTQRRLAEIWCNVLSRKRIGINESFFEIGGHSLRATIMLARVNKELGVDLNLGEVFDSPTIAALAQRLEGRVTHQATGLEPAPSRVHYPVTPTQGLLYTVCISRKGVEYNLPMAFDLRGELDIDRLEQAFRELIRRHEAFRTSFRTVAGSPALSVSPSAELAIERLEQSDADELRDVIRDFIRPFDLATAPLLRVALVPLEPEHHVMLLDMHHLISDGTSMGLMFQQLGALYQGEDPALPAATFKDFSEWLLGHLKGEKVREQEAHWRRVFEDLPTPLRLDTDYPRPDSFSFEGNRISFAARPGVLEGLRALCAAYEVTPYMVLLAVYNVLLCKHTGQEDIIVGVPTSGRYLADVQDVLGMFVNTHAIRCRPRGSLRFDELLGQVKTAVCETLENQDFQLWEILPELMQRAGGKPLFNTVFIVQDQAFETLELGELEVEEREVGYGVSKFDLTMCAVERPSGLGFELEYSTDLFKRRTIKRMADHYTNLLDQVIADPRRQVDSLTLLTPAEEDQLLHRFNRVAEIDRAAAGDIVGLFEQQVSAAPDQAAVLFEDDSLSYHQLNHRANRLARRLVRAGLRPGQVVAVLCEPSPLLLVGALAILKAGAAYLPLGKSFPQIRMQRLLEDSGADLVLADHTPSDGIAGVTTVDISDEASYDPNGRNLGVEREVHSLAYLSYCADQDGVLKGVEIEHGALLSRCRWFIEAHGITSGDRGAKLGDLATSASALEIFPLLSCGASICIIPREDARDIERLNARLERSRVTVAWLPASLCERLALVENTSLRLVMALGRMINGSRRSRYELRRCFGQAECAEVATTELVQSDGSGAVVGRPVTGTQLYVLDRVGSPSPIGVTGELCIGGPSLARGYRHDATGTEHRLAPDPFAAGKRMLRTGQPARWLADGRVELTGPERGQVIVDGYRIGLAELQRHIEAYRGIAEAVVVFEEQNPRHQRLVAFVVFESAFVVPLCFVQQLRSHLAQLLPEHMIPGAYIMLGEMPRTAGREVDYAALPVPRAHIGAAAPEQTSSPLMGRVASIVEELLDLPGVGSSANLLELGLDSLMAMRLISRINNQLGTNLDVNQLLMMPTIAGITSCLSTSPQPGSPITPQQA